jgi:hypothetical protein
MGLSDIEFTRTEMREMEEAAKESFRRRPHEKAVRLPKGTDLAALKRMMEHGNHDAAAVILGITLEQLRSIVK